VVDTAADYHESTCPATTDLSRRRNGHNTRRTGAATTIGNSSTPLPCRSPSLHIVDGDTVLTSEAGPMLGYRVRALDQAPR
jgi:hypothetical protein